REGVGHCPEPCQSPGWLDDRHHASDRPRRAGPSRCADDPRASSHDASGWLGANRRALRLGGLSYYRWWRGRDLNPRPSGYEPAGVSAARDAFVLGMSRASIVTAIVVIIGA